jgi:hypothetical protein
MTMDLNLLLCQPLDLEELIFPILVTMTIL